MSATVWGSWSPIADFDSGRSDGAIPVAVVSGSEPGPVVWVNGCVHGNEFGAAVVVQALIGAVEPSMLRGTLVALPVMNQAAFEAHSRVSPLDGKDLNRVFPGDQRGTSTDWLASAMWSRIGATVGYVVDVHASTVDFVGVAHAIYLAGTSPASLVAADLARSCRVPIVWQSTGTWLTNALFARATEAGLPSVLLDVGELKSSADIDGQTRGLLNILRSLKMYPGPLEPLANRWVVKDPVWIGADSDGILVDQASLGSHVRPGDTLFRVVGIQGDEKQRATHPLQVPGLVVTVRRAGAVRVGLDAMSRSGSEVMSVGEIVEDSAESSDGG